MTAYSDIVIVGGGLIGLSAALVLQHPSRRVEVLEAGPAQAGSGGLNARSIALSATSVQIFRALGIWPQIEAGAAPIRQIHVSARGRWGVARLDAADYSLDALGYVAENDALTACLLEAVAASKQIKLHQGAEFKSIEQNAGVRIGYRHKSRARKLDARLALLADGAGSRARDALGIGHHTVDYGQAVVLANVEVSLPRSGMAYERFTPQGPLAMLPLGGRRYACVWTLDPDRVEAVKAYSDDEFCAALQDCFGYRLGFVERVGKRHALPIRRTRADRLNRGNCLLVGNAANALHPVAGQSFNLSLRDIAALYELLVDFDLAQDDVDALSALLNTYAGQRGSEQRRVIGYGDGLVTLFSNQLPVFDLVRAAGLSLLDLVPALKTQVAFAGMGLAFGGNRLLRGHL